MENYRLVLPEHLNQFGYLFGGNLLKWVDETAWMAATLDYPGCHFVTVGMEEVSFRKSVRGGAILRLATGRRGRGETSVRYGVTVFRDEEAIFTTEVALVRVDLEGRKRSLPDD